MSRFTESSNPMMGEDKYKKASSQVLDADLVQSRDAGGVMTVQGTINKTLVLSAIMLVSTLLSFNFLMVNPGYAQMFSLTGVFGGIAIAVFAGFKLHLSPYLAPLYAAVEGLFVAAVSMYAVAVVGSFGIIFNAVSLTLALLFMMLFLYKAEIIKVTEKLRSGVMMATGAIMLVYLLNFVLSFFGMNVPYLHQGGMMGIGISLFIIGIASLNLLLDFDNVDKGVKYGSPKYMEWYTGMGLLATLVWLYYEMLHLLMQLAAND